MGLHWLASGPSVLASALAALAVLGWALSLEWRRRTAAWRWAALTVAIASGFLLVARPARLVEVPPGSAVVVTRGAGAEAAFDVESSAGTFAIEGTPATKAEPVADVALLARRHPEVRHWRVAGVGLPEWDLAALPGRVEVIGEPRPRRGLQSVDWSRRLTLGKPLTVVGVVHLPAVREASVQLLGPAGLEDEALLSPGEEGVESFSLTALPRHEGPRIYRLRLVVDGVEMAVETVDVDVGPQRPPRVLWLEGSPGFETRHVKNWLAGAGGSMLIRSRVSRGRFRYEYFNHERVLLSRLRADRLDTFDLVVLDDGSWQGLSPGDRVILEAAVGRGLGVLFVPGLPDLSRVEDGLLHGFELTSLEDLETVELRGYGPGLAPLAPLVTSARHLTGEGRRRALIRDGGGRVMAASRLYGLGVVAATVVESTHRWVLRGDGDTHGRYWSHLLESVSRDSGAGAAWRLPSGPVLVDEPFSPEWVAHEQPLLTVEGPGGDRWPLPTLQDVADERLWTVELRPREPGWHRLEGEGGEAWFYAVDAPAWGAWRDRRAIDSTARRAAFGRRRGGSSTEFDRVSRAFRPVWIFSLLLAALASVWADDQWRRSKPGGEKEFYEPL